MAVDTLYKALMQENVAEEERGRAMGSWVLSIGTAPVGHLGVGGLAGLLGAPGALLLNGGVLAFVSLGAAIGLPRLRRLSGDEVISVMTGFGFTVQSQKGSHVKLRRRASDGAAGRSPWSRWSR